ncbi:hypothetical protein [Wolbachia endosymbiont of Ctenocephalides felis wCfeT]|uniref:hypothetical protein n=1 Tax=Wolbachia endosymbiont of Ctenocephalides felis wCfeT TaxID=2732593 RepID=UPI001446EAA6|nr:hypothetical protein [Wolbachia endosymbiont of Ctenocephalides felis wCfeT]
MNLLCIASYPKSDAIKPTGVGNLDKNCVNASRSYAYGTEFYRIWKDSTPDQAECRNKIFNKDTHIQIAKVAANLAFDRCKPVVTISQKDSLMIVDNNDMVVRRDGKVSDVKFSECKNYLDKNGDEKRIITDCRDKGADCQTCKDAMYNFDGKIYVFADGCEFF